MLFSYLWAYIICLGVTGRRTHELLIKRKEVDEENIQEKGGFDTMKDLAVDPLEVPCSYYRKDLSGSCNYKNYPKVDINEISMFQSLKEHKCCSGRGHIIYDNCMEHRNDDFACSYPKKEELKHLDYYPSSMGDPACLLQLVRLDNLKNVNHKLELIDVHGKSKSSMAYIYSFCISYACLDNETYVEESWQPVALASVCIKKDYMKSLKDKFYPNLIKCCPSTLQVSKTYISNSVSRRKWTTKLFCTLEEGINLKINKYCENGIFQMYKMDYDIDITKANTDGVMKIKETDEEIFVNSTSYCVAYDRNFPQVFDGTLGTNYYDVLYHCRVPCQGQKPCIRLCCDIDEMLNSFGAGCIKMSPKVNKSFHRHFTQHTGVFEGITSHLTIKNFQKANAWEKYCDAPHQRLYSYKQSDKQNGNFNLVEVNGDVTLSHHEWGVNVYEADSYCLNVLSKESTFSAELCRINYTQAKKK